MSSPAVQVRSRFPRIAEAAVERARLTVVPRRRVRAARVPFVTLVTLLLLGGVVGLLLFNTSMQQSSFAATALEQQVTNLSARQQTLQMELERLRDPQRVAGRAQQLGMVLPPNPLYLDLADGSVEGDPAAATVATGLRLLPRPPARPAVLAPKPVRVIQPPPEGVLPYSAGDTTRASAERGSAPGTKSRSQQRR